MRKRLAALALALAAAPALAQTYPSKPIRILIAQAPGSATDVISRVVGNRAREERLDVIALACRDAQTGDVEHESPYRALRGLR